MLFPVAKAFFGHYRRYPFQIFLMWLGLTLGVSLLVGVLAINHHANSSYHQGNQIFSTPFPNKISSTQVDGSVTNEWYQRFISKDFPSCFAIQKVDLETDNHVGVSIIGIDPSVFMQIMKDKPNYLSQVNELKRPSLPLLISQSLASYLDIKDGDYLRLKDNNDLGPLIVDREDRLTGSQLVSNQRITQAISHSKDYSAILCQAMPRKALMQLKRGLPDELQLTMDRQSELATLTSAFHTNLLALGVISFVVGLFIFYQAISLSFVQRQPLVGTLIQLGTSSRELFAAIVVEMSVWIIVGWGSGNILGLVLANELMPTISNSLYSLYKANVSLLITWQWEWSYQSLVMAIIGCCTACAWPFYRLISTAPIRLSAKLSVTRFAGIEFKIQAMFAFFLLTVVGCIYFIPGYEVKSVFFIGFFMLSIGLLTPFIIWSIFEQLSYRFKNPKLRWFFSDSAAGLSYRGVAAMAFTLALASNIGVETMVGSFRETTNNWLERRLAADIYIQPSKGSTASLSDWLKEQPEIEAVWKQREVNYQSQYGKLEILSTGASQGERDALPIKVAMPDYWSLLYDARGLLISESMALKLDLKPGDHLTFSEPMGKNWKILGIYYDYGNSYNQILLSHTSWLNVFGNQGIAGIGLVLKDKEKRALLVDRLIRYPDLSVNQVTDNHDMRQKAMKTFDQTFAVTASLGHLTLIVSVFGLFFATLAGEISRQRQSALLRFLGISTRELIVFGGLQLFSIGLFSIVIALPLGLVLSQLLIDSIMRYTFGWTIDMKLFPYQYSYTFLWILIGLALAGGVTVWNLIRRQAIILFRESL